MLGAIVLTQEETLIDSIFELRPGRKCICGEGEEWSKGIWEMSAGTMDWLGAGS